MIKTGASFNRNASKQDYETPQDFLYAVTNRFGPITVDLAARADNSKGAISIGPDRDSLAVSWKNFAGICWLNPPFDNIAPWAKKCAEESGGGVKILFLTPASVGSNWFSKSVFNRAKVIFLNGRLKFVGAKDPYPKDCILSCFGFGETGFEVWKWKETT